MDERSKERAERFDIVALIEVHHLERLELFVAVAIFLDLGELGLNFAHEAGLMELALHERPAADFHQNDKKDNSETKVAH